LQTLFFEVRDSSYFVYFSQALRDRLTFNEPLVEDEHCSAVHDQEKGSIIISLSKKTRGTLLRFVFFCPPFLCCISIFPYLLGQHFENLEMVGLLMNPPKIEVMQMDCADEGREGVIQFRLFGCRVYV
jgi:hypothetical protein